MILLQSFVDLNRVFKDDDEAHEFISGEYGHGDWASIGPVADVTSVGAHVDLDDDLKEFFSGPDLTSYLYSVRDLRWDDDGTEDEHGLPRGSTEVVLLKRVISYWREEEDAEV